jgi:hypothetical protein
LQPEDLDLTEELDITEEVEETEHSASIPKFEVVQITSPEALGAAGMSLLIETMTSESHTLDAIREAVHEGKGGEGPVHDFAYGHVQLDVETPPSLLFVIGIAENMLDIAIRVGPEQFDRSDEAQEELYQVFLGIIQIYAEAPIVDPTESGGAFVGYLRYYCCPDQATLDKWKGLFERWTAYGT